MKIKMINVWMVVLVAALLLIYSHTAAQVDDPDSMTPKTVLGPRNLLLYDGAQALLANDVERGVELTLRGLDHAMGAREQKMAHSNLCAGYLMLKQTDEALRHCNLVLEMDADYWRAYNNRALVYLEMGRYEESGADIERGRQLRPREKKLKIVKSMLLDETKPVRERVSIDDRRSTLEEDEER